MGRFARVRSAGGRLWRWCRKLFWQPVVVPSKHGVLRLRSAMPHSAQDDRGNLEEKSLWARVRV
jgi:hypothetical protein